MAPFENRSFTQDKLVLLNCPTLFVDKQATIEDKLQQSLYK